MLPESGQALGAIKIGASCTYSMFTRSPSWTIFGVFFFESLALGQWIPRIPDIKARLELSDSYLGFALLSMPLGALVAFAIAGRLVEKLGLRNSCRMFLPLWSLLFIAPAFAQTFIQLLVALAISGVAIGLIETAMNSEAANIEKAAGKRLMSRCHGFWSLGTMTGALLAGAIAQWNVGIDIHFAVVMPLIAIGGYRVATALPSSSVPVEQDKSSGENASSMKLDTGVFTFPDRAIFLLCIMPLGVMMVEGAIIDWSAVFMRDVMAADPILIAVTYAFFSIVMATVRMTGDHLSEKWGDTKVIRVSGLASTLGIVVFALAPDPYWAFVGAAITGAGVAIVFPLAVTAAANRPGRPSSENVAALNMFAFSAILVAPGFIGLLAESIGLRYALFSLAPLAFMTFILAREVEPPGS